MQKCLQQCHFLYIQFQASDHMIYIILDMSTVCLRTPHTVIMHTATMHILLLFPHSVCQLVKSFHYSHIIVDYSQVIP